MKYIQHNKLGKCEVLIEVESHGKNFMLIKTKGYVKKSNWRNGYLNIWTPHEKAGIKAKLITYVLWGNTDNHSMMGITKVSPAKGNSKFFKLIKTSEHLTFSK